MICRTGEFFEYMPSALMGAVKSNEAAAATRAAVYTIVTKESREELEGVVGKGVQKGRWCLCGSREQMKAGLKFERELPKRGAELRPSPRRR